ncbi:MULTISPECIES: hypothetical protein [Arcobacteraceae]|uniref:Cadherin domain-containing protein n=1 Tax=Poseidonibacter parvus TaxID=1850254 RepID=A0A1P8KN52_9BACT|nr:MULTISPECIES: hypothetical protein [Arcobacteraceae]APW65939.1 hypothetical protein LPB137_08750 [Poseidonibacter parvus]
MQNFKNILISSITASFLIACGGGGSSSSSSSSLKSLSGTIIDGYIKDATVCLDINSNGLCDTTEPLTQSLEDGTFTFKDVEVETNKLYPVISIGGIDTATGKAFDGELKNVFDSNTINSGESLTISPLTDLVATSFLQSTTKDESALLSSRDTISTALGLTTAQLDNDPMKNTEVFAKAQEIQQIKELIKTSSQKNLSTQLTIEQQNSITEALVKQIAETNTIDISKVLTNIETDLSITIPSNEKTFIVEQSDEIKTNLTILSTDTTIDITKLDEIQNAFEIQMNDAYTIINNATSTDILTKVTIPDVSTLLNQGEAIATNTAPYFLNGTDKITSKTISLDENATLDLSILAKDDDSDTLTYTLSGVDKNHFAYNSTTSKLTSISFDHENAMDANNDNVYNLQLIVNDGKERSSLNLLLTINNLDDNTPIMNDLADITLNKNDSVYTLTLNATDLDGTEVSYTAASQNTDDLYTLAVELNVLTITPIVNKYGTDVISITASSNGKSVTKAFNLTIKDTGALVIPTNTVLPQPPMMPTLQGN